MMERRIVQWILLGLGLVAMSGCSSNYILHGKVLPGTYSIVTIVNNDDDRLNGDGVANARIELYRNPETLGRKLVATAITDNSGAFEMDVEAFGAGWLKELWLIRVTHGRFASADETIRLPKQKQDRSALIMLGSNRGIAPNDPQAWRRDINRFR